MWVRVLLCSTAMIIVVACAPTSTPSTVLADDAITVASFNFDESQVVAEIYAQALEAAGFTVHRVPQVGTRELVIPALERGLVEVVPEYAGSASSFLGGSPTADRSTTHDELSELLHDRGIEALDAAPAQNHNALVVSAETADALSLRSISDLMPYARDMTLGGPPECPSRELCLLGLETVYGLAFNSFLPLGGGGTFTGEAITRGSVDVGIMFTTDSVLAGHDLVVLDDDRGLQPAENLTPLVREDTLQRFGPQVADVLDLVSAQLTTEALRSLNGEIERGSEMATVAEAWLNDHDLAPRGVSEAPAEAQ
jgi:osmoprotectant transport system substrate-binding protein